jgi:predicted AAA+ superfamily ATPase
MYINRPNELDFLHRNKDAKLIKVVSGVRRSGKSTILEIFRDELRNAGVDEAQIQSYNFDELDYVNFRSDYMALYQTVSNELVPGKQNYIFLDEIQWVDHFEEVVNSLFLKENVDIYITGSNAFFLSGEFATVLTGRYVSLEMYPLSYSELYNQLVLTDSSITKEAAYEKYLVSSFPQATQMTNKAQINDYLEGLYNTVLVKDVAQRLKLANLGVLERISKVLFASIGNIISMKKIANTLTSAGLNTSSPTVAKYVDALVDAKLFYRAQRYDIAGRRYLEARDKYYVVDAGLRNLTLASQQQDYGHILENIVYLELRRRGYKVYVGQIDKFEVDFVAIDPEGNRQYIQVSLTTLDENTLARELRSFENIHDAYPKLLLTLDVFNKRANYEGVVKEYALDWLLGDESK